MAELNIVLVEPEIPQNTGNVARTCAVTGAALHLVKPMEDVLQRHHRGDPAVLRSIPASMPTEDASMASKTLLFCMITASEQERSDPTAHNVRIARIHQRFVDFLHRSVQKRVPVVAHHAPRHRRVQRRQQRRVQRLSRASLAAERLAEQSEELGERFGADFALLPMRKRPKKERARWNGRPAARPAACCARGAAARAAAGGRRRRSRCPSANRRGTRRRRGRSAAALRIVETGNPHASRGRARARGAWL